MMQAADGAVMDGSSVPWGSVAPVPAKDELGGTLCRVSCQKASCRLLARLEKQAGTEML